MGLLLCGTVKAQEYDETKLLGTWEVVNLNGPMSLQLLSFKSIELREQWFYNGGFPGKVCGVTKCYEYGDTSEEEYRIVSDFFISNGNKLHIQLRHEEYVANSLRFIITDFTDNEIKLTTYDGKTSFSLRRDLESGAKSIKTEESSTGKEYYNLNGVRISSPEPGIVITKENNEVRKEIFK